MSETAAHDVDRSAPHGGAGRPRAAPAPRRATPFPGTSEEDAVRNRAWAHFVLRVFVGVNLATHGIVRVLGGVGAFADHLAAEFARSPIPAALVRAFGVVLPPIELVLGLAILLGLWLRPTLIAAGLVLALLTFGSCLRQDWVVAGTQLVYALAYYVLLARLSDDRTSIDGWLRAR